MLSSSKTDTISPQLIEGLLAPVPGFVLELLADDGLYGSSLLKALLLAGGRARRRGERLARELP